MAGSEYNKACSTLITDACLIFLHKSPKILSMRAKKTCLILKRNINEVKRNGPINYPQKAVYEAKERLFEQQVQYQ